MRGYRTIGLALCALILSACGNQTGTGAQAHPDGWQIQKSAKGVLWTDPRDPRQQYTSMAQPNANGTLADLGAKVTINTLLSRKGAKLLAAVPFPGCPGEAGLETFSVSGTSGKDVLRVAYVNWSGTVVIATYERPSSAPDDPAAANALARAVCTSVEGVPTLPPASR